MKYKIVNFLGGPGTSKSTMATDQFSRFKRLGVGDIGLDLEPAKEWAYINRPISGFDGLELFTKSFVNIDRMLRGGAKVVFTDAGPITSIMYEHFQGAGLETPMKDLLAALTNTYPTLNIYLRRDLDKKYVREGRYQNEEEAKQLDGAIFKWLLDNKLVDMTASSKDPKTLFRRLTDALL